MLRKGEDEVRIELALPVAPRASFDHFVSAFGEWYPAHYSWSGDELVWIGFEPRSGGACYELGPEGFRCDWGRVLVWEPPHRLVLSWQIGMNREPVPDFRKASELEFRWSGEGDGSRLFFTHHDFAKHGEGWEAYRAAMASEAGWPLILDGYVKSLGGGVTPAN